MQSLRLFGVVNTLNIDSLDIKIPSIMSNFPVSACRPGPQLLPISACSIFITIHLAAFPLATVLHQDPDVQCHLFIQVHLLHTRLHSPHQGPGLLNAKTLSADTQHFTLDTVQDDDQGTATEIPDINKLRHTGEQGGQVFRRD